MLVTAAGSTAGAVRPPSGATTRASRSSSRGPRSLALRYVSLSFNHQVVGLRRKSVGNGKLLRGCVCALSAVKRQL